MSGDLPALRRRKRQPKTPDCQIHHRQRRKGPRDPDREETDLLWERNTNNRIGLREAESDNEPASQQDTFREVNREGYHSGPFDGWTTVEEPSPAKRDEWN